MRYSLAIIEERLADADCEAGGPVEAVPGRVGRWTRVRVECDVRSRSRTWRTRLRRGPARTRICGQKKQIVKNRQQEKILWLGKSLLE